MNGVRYAVQMNPDATTAQPFPRVGMIGLGVMGHPMAAHCLRVAEERSSQLTVTARNRERVSALVDAGASWAATPRRLAEQSDVIVLMLPDLHEVEQVLEGADGLLAGITMPTVIAIGSTSSPEGVRLIADMIGDRTAGLATVIDSPVSGGEDGAIAGTLSIMVGGAPDDFERAGPALRAFGTPVLLGPLGSGQIAKACNQMIVASAVLALGEAIVIAERSGLDVRALLTLLSGGYAGSRVLETRLERFVNKDYSPSGVAKYMVKDLSFARAQAARTATVTSQLDLLFDQFSALVAEGFGDSDIAVTRAFVESHTP